MESFAVSKRTVECRPPQHHNSNMISFMKNHRRNAIFFGVALILFLLGYGMGKRASDIAESDMVFAEVDGSKIYGRDVLPLVDEQIVELEKSIFRAKRAATEDLIGTLREAKSLKPNTYLTSVTDLELNQFAKSRGVQTHRLSEKQRKDLVANFQIHRSHLVKAKERQDFAQSASVQWRIPVLHRKKTVDVRSGELVALGGSNRANRIVIFSNYHCGRCSGFSEKLRIVADAVPEQVSIFQRYIVREGDAQIVEQTVRGGFCADDQKKFLEYHDAVSAAAPVDGAALQALLVSLKFDVEKFNACLVSKNTEARLFRDFEESQRIGREPTAVVNGHPLPLQEPVDEYLYLLGK